MKSQKDELNNYKNERRWHAQWIWDKQDGSANTWMCFRKSFELPEGVNSAKAWISAETKYWFWMNGWQVVFEGSLNRGPEPGRGYYDVIDLKNYIKSGCNTIAVLVWYWGNEGRNNADCGKGGLLLEAEFDDIRVCSDSSWILTVHPAYGRTEDLYAKLVLEDTKSIRAILPYAAQITPYFKIKAEYDGLKIEICTDRYNVNGGPGDSHNIYRGHRTEYITRCDIQEFEVLDWLFGEEVIYSIPDGVEVLGLGYRETGYDCKFSGSFKCSDDFLNRLYDKCRRTLYACMRNMEGYVLEALCRMGFTGDALMRMRERYDGLVKNSNTTLWEDFYELGTKNHAWSGGPLTVLMRYIAGIDAETSGFDTYHVMPRLSGLNNVNVVVPSTKGNISVEMVTDENVFKLQLESPEDTIAIVGIPRDAFGKAGEICSGTGMLLCKVHADGAEAWSVEGTAETKAGDVSYYGENASHVMFCVKPGEHEFLASFNNC